MQIGLARAWRWFLAGLAALLLALLVLAVGVSAYLATSYGRSRLAAAVVADINRSIPGHASLRELERFSLTHVVLRDVGLRAPAGNDVLTIGRVRARLVPWWLLLGRIVVSELSLEDGVVDLRFAGDRLCTLPGALVDPRAAAGPHASNRSIDFMIRDLRVERWRIRPPSPGAGWPEREIQLVTATAHVDAGSELRLEVEQLHARIREGQRDIGAVSGRGRWRSAGVSSFALGGELLGMRLDLAVTLGEPGRRFSRWQSMPFSIQLDSSELTMERLRELTASTAAWPALDGPWSARLTLRGVPEAFQALGTVQTPAGDVTVEGSARDLSALELSVQTESLALRRLSLALPDWRVASRVALAVERERDGPVRFRMTSSASARVDGVPLPALTLRGTRDGGSPWRFELGSSDRWLSLSAQGSLADDGTSRGVARGWFSARDGLALARSLRLPNGSRLPPALDRVDAKGRVELSLEFGRDLAGDLDVHAALGSPELELGGTRLRQLAVALALAGKLGRPRLRADGRWQAAPRGSSESSGGRLKLDGGPRRYRLQLRSGSLASGSFAVSGWLEREPAGRRFALTASGRRGAAPWRLAIKDARLLDTGQLSLPSVKLELCEQTFHLHGHYAGAASRLALTFDQVDIARLLRPAGGPRRLAGRLSGRVDASGDLKRPELQLSLRATRVGLSRGAGLDARLDGTLDLGRGSFQLRAEAQESAERAKEARPRLDVTLDASGDFEPRRPWPRNLMAGEQRAKLDITRLDSAMVAELAGTPLPAHFDVHGSVDIDVQHGVPVLAYAIAGPLSWSASSGSAPDATKRSRSAQLEHSARYDQGRLDTDLSIADGEGPWVSLQGNLDPFAGKPPALLPLLQLSKAEWMRRLATASWHVDLDAQRRTLGALPLPHGLRRLGAAAIGARLVAHRDRGADPEGELSFDIGGAELGSDHGARCSAPSLTAQGQLALREGRFHAAVSAFGDGTRKLQLDANGELDAAGWLDGHVTGRPRLDVVVDAAGLPLERLPFICDELRGRLTAQARIGDPLGSVTATGDVRIEGFSLGSDETLDVSTRLTLDPSRLELVGDMRAAGRRSSFAIRAPRVSGPARAGAPPIDASFELSELPLAPLVPLDGPISHASGHVSGSLRASAGGAAPRFAGSLRLDGVGLTVTELAQPLSDINGELSLSDGALNLKRLSARDGEGELSLSGQLRISSARAFDARLKLKARKFPLRQQGEVVAQTTASANVDATWRPERNRLRVVLDGFDTWLERRDASRGMSLAPHADIRLKPGRAAAPPVEPAPPRGLFRRARPRAPAAPAPLTIQIESAKPFWVKRADFAFKLTADLDISVEPAPEGAEGPSVSTTGQLQFERGYMEIIGKTFVVKKGGLLRFLGGTASVLDLTAYYDDRRSSQRVTVRLQGSIAAPKLDFFVDGQKVAAGEAFQAIYGSQKASDDDVEPEAQASQIISALVAGVLTTSMRRRLGAMAPILSVDPADDESGDQVRAGFELDALIPAFLRKIVTGVYVEGSLSSEKPGQEGGEKELRSGVLIELYFPYNLVSSGRYGPDATWSLDVGWQPRGH